MECSPDRPSSVEPTQRQGINRIGDFLDLDGHSPGFIWGAHCVRAVETNMHVVPTPPPASLKFHTHRQSELVALACLLPQRPTLLAAVTALREAGGGAQAQTWGSGSEPLVRDGLD